MIFRTITNESTGAIKSIGLFGKTIDELKKSLSNVKTNGLFNTFFNTSLIDETAIAKYNAEIVKATANGATMADKQQIMKTAMEGTNKATAQLIGSTNGATVSTEALTAAQHSSTLAARAQAVALKAASIAGNMILFAVISKGIELVVKGFDNWIHRVEKANETMDEAVGEYESAKSSLESVNSELDEQNKRLDELLAKDKLTYAEKGQLEELQKITQELLLQQDIEEKRAANASKEAADKTVEAYKKQYGKYDKTEDELKEKLSYHAFPEPESKNDILGIVAAYIRSKELLEQSQKEYNNALKEGEDTTWLADDLQYNIDAIDSYSQALDNAISDIYEKHVALKEEYDKTIKKRNNGIEPLTSSDKDIIETYESIYDVMRIAYEYTDPNTWKSMQIENVFNTEGIEKTKEELIEMVKAGTFDEGTLQSYSKLSEALKQNGVSANELRNELEALAKQDINLKDDNFSPSFSKRFQALWDSDDFSDSRKELQKLSMQSRITEKDILSLANENATLSTLLDDTGMSAQFAASCFTKVCQGADGFSAITEDSLALDRALNELEGSLVLVKNAKSEYDKAMETDDYNSEFKNYQEAYKAAMEMFDHGEYGKHFRSTMEYLLGDKSYTMEIDELYQAVKNLKNVFGDESTNGLEFLDKLYSKKEILDDLDSSLKKLSDGSYKFDLKPEEFEQIADSLGMTTEGVAACVNALGMFGEFKAYDIEAIEKTLKDFSIAVEDSGKSILSLQAVEQMLSDLGRTDYEIVSIMQDIQGLGSIKLLDFEASDEKTLDEVISKLKELSLIEINGKNINVDSLITNLQESFHMASPDIETFINNIGTKLGNSFNFSDAEGNLLSLKGAIDKVQQSEDDSSIKNMEGLGEATKLAEKEAVILHGDFKKLNASDLSHITWQFTKLGTNIAMLKGQVQGLINQLELAGEKAKPDNYPSPGNSGNNPPPNPGNPNQNNTNQGTAHALGNVMFGNSYSTGNIGVEKDETALINELGNETIIDPNTNTYEIVQGGAQFKKLKKGQIILNHLQTKALQKYGKISSFGKMLFRGNTSLSGHAYASGTVSKNNPATNKDWGNKNSTKTSNKKKKSSDKDKDKDKKTKETIDWISRKFDIMAKQLDVIKKKASEVYSTFRNQNKQLNSAIKEIDKQINVYNKAYTKYMKKANSVGLDENLVKKVKDGSLNISDYDDKTAEKIEQYKEWYDKGQDVLATITALKLEQKELARQKLSNIVDDFDRKKSYQEAQASLREAKMGDNPKEKDYNYLIKKQNHMKTNLKKEYEELNKEFKNLMDEGVIKKYSDSWYEWKEKLVDCKVALADCDNEIKDLTKSIIELRWEKFDTAIEKLTRVQDILKDFTTFFDADTFDGTTLTKAGMANITAAFQGLANVKQEMVNYQSSKKSLAAQLTNGDIDQKYHDEKLKELEDGERQAAIKMKEYRDSILDIYIQGIDAETDAMRDLVQAKKDALDAERDLHNYRNSIADKEEDIVILQKKIAELSKSTDRKDIALRLELEEELANAQKDLSEEQYNHDMDLKQEALDQELKNFEAAQEEKKDKAKNSLEEQERILNDYLTKVQNNYNSTMEYALKYAAEYGISMSEFLSSPWEKSIQKAKEYKDLVEGIKPDVKVSSSAVDTNQNDYPKKVIGTDTLGTGILTGIKVAAKDQGTIQSTKSTAMEELYNIKDKNTLIPGTAKRKFKLNGYKNGVKDLKRDELARISENGNYEVILRPGEGLLAPLQQHDNVLTHAQTESLMGWSQINPMEFMQAINHATIPSVTVQSQSPFVIESVDASVHVSGVTRDEISKEILRECDKIPDKIVKAAYRGGYRPRL